MADWPPLKNSAFTVAFPIFDNDGDLVTAAADLDSEVSIDGGTFTDVSPGEAIEIATSSGLYKLALALGEMNGDYIATITKTSTSNAKTAVNVMYTVTRQLKDLAFPTTSGRGIDVETTGEVGINLDNVTGTLDAAEIGAGAITSGKFASGAINATALASDAVTEIRSLVSGTADSGSTSTLVDDALNEADTDYWKGAWLLITSGTSANQVRLITGFTPGTDTITFAPVLTQAITTNTYEILPAGSVNVQQWLSSTVNALVSGAVDADVSALQGDVITAAAIANAAIDAATFAAGAIDAAALNADAIDEIWDEALTGHTTVGTVGQLLNALGARAGEVADAGATTTDFDVDGFTEATDNHFNGHVMVFTNGALLGQSRIITTYTGSGQNCAFDRAWTDAPADNDDFVILGPLAGALGRLPAVESDGHVHTDMKQWLGVAPLALQSQRVDSYTGAMAAGVVTATAVATDAIDADALAADAVDEIWNEAMSGHVTAGTFGEAMNEMFSSLISVTGDVSDAGALATDFDTDLTEASDDHYNGHFLVFTGGVLTGQARMIQDYDGTNKNVSFDRAFTEAPGNGDDFSILGGPSSALSTMLARLTDVESETAVSNRMMLWAVAKLANKVDATGASLLIKKTDDSTNLFTQTITTDSGADPITVLDTA